MTGADNQAVQGKRKTKVGRVASDKMDKTIVVSVERLARHRLYKRVIRLTTKFKAHDDANVPHRRHGPHRGVAPALGDQAMATGLGGPPRRRPCPAERRLSSRRPRRPRPSMRPPTPAETPATPTMPTLTAHRPLRDEAAS